MLLRGLTRRTLRKVMSSLAIAVSFAMLLSLFSVASGLYELSTSRFEGSPGDLVVSTQGLEPTIEDSHDKAASLLADEGNFSAAMPLLTVLGSIGIPAQADAGAPMKDADPFTGQMKVVSAGLIGIVPDMTEPFIEGGSLSIRSEKLEIGGWFSEGGDPFFDSDYRTGWTGEAILDENIMEENGLFPGAIFYVLAGNGTPVSSFRVIAGMGTSLTGGGIVGRLVGGAAIFHLSELQYATGNDAVVTSAGEMRDLSTGLYLKVAPDMKGAGEARRISDTLSGMFPGHMVSTEEGRLYRLQEEVVVFEVFAASVGMCALLIGMMFLSSIMLIEQEERRSETALLRAIGVSRASIYRGMLAESIFLASIGAVAGAVPGVLGSELLDSYLKGLYGLDVSFTEPSLMVIGASIAFLMANVLLFSTIPGMYIMRMDIRSSLGRSVPR